MNAIATAALALILGGLMAFLIFLVIAACLDEMVLRRRIREARRRADWLERFDAAEARKRDIKDIR